MSGKVIILGAKGRFGRAAVKAFSSAGWQVRAFARQWETEPELSNTENLTGNAFNNDDLIKASEGVDVIINALNPPYPLWVQDIPKITTSVINAAKASGATVIIPGNVYNYGEAMPEQLTENTPHKASTRKGQIREEMEQTYAQTPEVQTIVLRAGDFIEREKTGNWFDSQIANKVHKGQVMYPGPLDQVHAWAYLPDLARAMVGLAEKRASLGQFEEFGFTGYGLTGQKLIEAMETVSGKHLKVKTMPWPIIKFLSFFNPQMREVMEMAYLWKRPHNLVGTKLTETLPDFKFTPLKEAVSDALGF